MSWWGTHPILSKAEGRRLLGRPCRLCLYIVRIEPDRASSVVCYRCGNKPKFRIRTPANT